jgi:hypothetical protein
MDITRMPYEPLVSLMGCSANASRTEALPLYSSHSENSGLHGSHGEECRYVEIM